MLWLGTIGPAKFYWFYKFFWFKVTSNILYCNSEDFMRKKIFIRKLRTHCYITAEIGTKCASEKKNITSYFLIRIRSVFIRGPTKIVFVLFYYGMKIFTNMLKINLLKEEWVFLFVLSDAKILKYASFKPNSSKPWGIFLYWLYSIYDSASCRVSRGQH